ncbi:hypothetical protein A3J90_05965 [candidate division WOR-1 bacterium RIFOXYC2_FULL_37_10]|uniref:Alpha-D-phosphohexomutase alpha/beta/alpha domain-containing protein n=1 Tax=candidate division WOR-1 bacterium RIFOXYB2_FULL_37_13 TaxID=1802579 RepID=A0A1F4SWU6_UNCSA|nr:MAG: hypothetical protein A2246_06430 [candidate division WOR-1 bacterium RIFOXYA2_FULL_37_7]OGC24837.1 MAG: hypothetical protein A2310_03760 [candidate division WOR-1 bacterium RIFOXYB2_FULL_37_13]OGC34931.1 MAG: hypothetical protein A3J90_05965 [candidate division WOR-1 bacterium RIFOXYC2_FULL_37_10]
MGTGALLPGKVRDFVFRGGRRTYGTLNEQRTLTIKQALRVATLGIKHYLQTELAIRNLSQETYVASLPAIDSIRELLTNEYIYRLCPSVRDGIVNSILNQEWNSLIDAHYADKMFGTAGVRGVAHRTEEDVFKVFKNGLEIPRLRGPNWINELTVARVAQGIIHRMKTAGEKRIVIGCDPRVGNLQLAEMLARIAIANDMQVFLADKECPFPLLMHAITQGKVKIVSNGSRGATFSTYDGEAVSPEGTLNIEGAVGMYISASHNGRKDNGFKFFKGDSSQAGPEERRETVKEINKLRWEDIKVAGSLDDAKPGQLVYIGGKTPVQNKGYHGAPLLDVEKQHRGAMLELVINPTLLRDMAPKLVLGYSAFNGAGGNLFRDVAMNIGIKPKNFLSVDSLFSPDGRFLPFGNKMPDPGDVFGAGVFFNEFETQYGKDALLLLNAGMMSHDPDADRAALMLALHGLYKEAFGGADWVLIKANLHWSVLNYYRFSAMAEQNGGNIPNLEKRYVMLSHATTDMIELVARHFGIAVKGLMKDEKTGQKLNVPEADSRFIVGMNYAADAWRVFADQGLHNDSVNEESNGFGIFGSAPLHGQRLGHNGWILDKDGFLASLLTLELFAYLKSRNMHYLDYVVEMSRKIGTYIGSSMLPLPETPWTGPTGTQMKQLLLNWAVDREKAFLRGETVKIGDRVVAGVTAYRTNKYPIGSMVNPPDQGVKSTYSDGSWSNVRPSGTANQLRGYQDLRNPRVATAETNQAAIKEIATTERMAVEYNRAMFLQIQEDQGIPTDKII